MIDYKQLPEISCIYKIVNLTEPSKFYIGSAKNLKTRVYHHINSLKNNDHHSYLLQRSVNKHGLDNFNVHIIDFVKEDNLKVKEQWWLDTLEPFYNIAKTADRPEGTTDTLETRLKISRTQRGKKQERNSTGFANVSYKARDKTYAVEISVEFTKYYLGSFKDIEQATKIADKYRFALEQDILEYINTKKQSKIKKSEYNYVSYTKYKNKINWYSYYSISRRERIFFGYYSTELEAVRAYNNYITINKINKPILIIKSTSK